jgi:hypothetical protein
MGLDYIRNTRGKPWRKQWAQGLNLMNEPTLFDIAFNTRRRTVSAFVEVETPPATGAELLLELIGSDALVFDGQLRVARVENLPDDVLVLLHRTDNIALATVEHVSLFGDMMELSLK